MVVAFTLSGDSLLPALCLRSLSLALSFRSLALSFLSLVLSLELLSVRSLTLIGVGGRSSTLPFPCFASSNAFLNSLAISAVLNLQKQKEEFMSIDFNKSEMRVADDNVIKD